MPGSAAFIIDIAGVKLRSELASADSTPVFAVWHRSAVDDSQSASVSHGQKGDLVALWSSRRAHSSPTALSRFAAIWAGKLHAARNVCRRTNEVLATHTYRTTRRNLCFQCDRVFGYYDMTIRSSNRSEDFGLLPWSRGQSNEPLICRRYVPASPALRWDYR